MQPKAVDASCDGEWRRVYCNVFSQVVYKPVPFDWFMLGGVDDPDLDRVVIAGEENSYFYQKW